MENPHGSSLSKAILTHIIVAVVAAVSVYCFTWIASNWTTANVVSYVERTAKLLEKKYCLVAVEVSLVVFIISCYHVAVRIYRRYVLAGTAKAAGMFFYSANSNNRTLNKSNKFLIERSLDCRNLQILGATGWKTFGKIDSPLNKALEKCDSAEIILLSPFSNNLKVRAKDIRQDEKEYQKEIIWSVLFLQEIRAARSSTADTIKLKFCDSYPGWKYIFIDSYVWVQMYPNHKHVADSPSYAYHRVSGGIYEQLFYQFRKRWKSAWVCEYDFEKQVINCAGTCPGVKNQPLSLSTLLKSAPPRPKTSEVLKTSPVTINLIYF